ncbi:hypothetical protein R5R35_008786 [Gryllus longicercus]|uniref:tRNA (adenine(58)-N(1))-methyltransferase non-catalytic subunit TRM6 n=1 Tax=Gryllus longicercus TaxID=2509291 RepID=A0AAN9W0K1_9ORTH
MSEGSDEVVRVGEYIVLQRQSYTKLHKVSDHGTVMLGKDQIDIKSIIGKPLWTTYKMEPKKGSKRDFILAECDSAESLAEQLIKAVSSGVDNRNIFDDGNSQQLSTEEIISMRQEGMSGQDIVGQLVENSKTFRDKTEYSQEKYLKKKEKKYFEYVTIRKPTIRLIAQILYRQDSTKIMGLRMDTLSQISTAAGVQSQGTYLLYESGCQGLVAAALVNSLDEGGCLVHTHAGNIPQKQAILAMNFSEAQKSRLISVNIHSLLRKLHQLKDSIVNTVSDKDNQSSTCNGDHVMSQNSSESEQVVEVEMKLEKSVNISTESKNNNEEKVVNINENEDVQNDTNDRKRKHSDVEDSGPKKPRWELETERAALILKSQLADGLIVVAKEHPRNIFLALLEWVNPSRPFTVFCLCREPLMDLYVYLKSRNDVIALRLTESWLRTHQILPNRTHPDILMSGSGGYLLSGIVVRDTAVETVD